ncbi:MAG: amidohydrolase family protein [Thermoanaerobaculia bacterium]
MKLRLVAGSRTVDVEDGRIASRAGAADLTLPLGEAEIRPGLVNAHDHLHRNHLPRLGTPPYASVYEWGEDLHERFLPELEGRRAIPRERALLFGALKNLLGGATTAVHHDPWEHAFERGFPIRVPRLSAVHSLGLDADSAATVGFPGEWFALHLAEGTDARTAEEVRKADRLGLLGPHFLAVHAVGADEDGIARLVRSRSAVVWCPTSNFFLSGRTTPAALLAGVDVLLGTDALVSGEGTLLSELTAARSLGLLSDARLTAAVSDSAARRLGLPLPSLDPLAAADLVVLRRPLLLARPRDLALVLVGGRPALADAELGEVFAACGVPAESLSVGGVPKLVAAPLGDVAREVFDRTPDCRRIVQ